MNWKSFIKSGESQFNKSILGIFAAMAIAGIIAAVIFKSGSKNHTLAALKMAVKQEQFEEDPVKEDPVKEDNSKDLDTSKLEKSKVDVVDASFGAPISTEVLAKNTIVDKHFDSFEEANLDDFGDFQKNFSFQREKIVEESKKIDSKRLASLKDMVKKFSSEDMAKYSEIVPENMLYALREEVPSSIDLHDRTDRQDRQLSWPSDVSESEARSLAREVFQSVSKTYSSDIAFELLKEMSNAATECSKIGIVLPDFSEEQVSELEFWASQKGKQSDYAKKILSMRY